MRAALTILRWLILVPAYVVLMAFCAAWVMEFFTDCRGLWRAHFDVVMFSCSVLESVGLCLFSAWIAPSLKRFIGVSAALGSLVLSLKRWSFVLVTEGWTRPMVGELAAEFVGGALSFLGLVLIHSLCAKRAEARG